MSDSGLGSSIRRGRAILRASWKTLRQNPRLAWFPVLSGLLVSCFVGVAGLLAYLGQESELASMMGDMARRAATVGGLVAYGVGHVLSVSIGVAMTHAALESLAGRPWTLRQAFALARQRRRAVITFAVVRATVGRLLATKTSKDGKRRQKSPGVIKKLARAAWWAATYLVLPVIAREGKGGLAAIERSAKLFRETWRDALVARFAVAWLWVPAVIVAAMPVALLAALGVREPPVLAGAVLVPALVLLVLGLLLHTLDGIYRAALYTYASEGVVPDTFDAPDLDAIWHAPEQRPSRDEPE
jgi:hypothetical protein